ncbi:uracil-xanthine permease [Mycolicibacterium iranicum]|uniref:Uracil-xanthine permease n=1 Tax=Mycolicibacterium iranicum TaxID=912594 RepID=A0A839PYT6_MYCIR|nr:solute carrier family 23 protein [Mycolicibacterium iranicum]MBB2989170.1 uracil-xanthine permease [Mycolicibacterium iranicum]
MSEVTVADDAVLDVGIQDRVSLPKTGLFGLQHLLALTGIWIFPVLIGATLDLSQQDVSRIVQACFLLTGLVTILQSSRIVRLPIVQGPTAAFFVAILAGAATYDLGTAFGSMVVAGLIFMALSIPVGRWGLFGHIRRFAADPIVFGTLFIIIGAQLASIGLPGWFGTPGTDGYGWSSFWIGLVVVVVIVACMIFGGNTLFKRAAIVTGIVVGSILALIVGVWSPPDIGQADLLGVPTLFPFGFGVAWPVVVLMLLAYFQAGAEAMGMYTLVAGWGGEKLSVNRINRGLFTEFLGSTVGAAFGGIGTTSYPENVGIIRITRIGSRFVTMAAGTFALALAFLPQVSLFIAGLSGAVLSAASTILFGIIAISGVQMLQKVRWDDLNVAVAATSFIVSLGAQWIPEDILAGLPPQVAGLIDTPMMLGILLLLGLHIAVNFGARPMLERRHVAAPTPVHEAS